MTLKGVTTKDLADAQGWSMSTAYRKITAKLPSRYLKCSSVRSSLIWTLL